MGELDTQTMGYLEVFNNSRLTPFFKVSYSNYYNLL